MPRRQRTDPPAAPPAGAYNSASRPTGAATTAGSAAPTDTQQEGSATEAAATGSAATEDAASEPAPSSAAPGAGPGADGEAATAPAAPAPRRSGRRKPPPPTVVLLVRHGTTTTTGKELPGRAPGLHLSDLGREQARRLAARIAVMAGVPVEEAPSDAQAITSAGGVIDPASDGSDPDGSADDRRRPGLARSLGRARGRGRSRDRGERRGSAGTLDVTAVYSSPLERTRETAAPKADALGLGVTVDDGLLELDVGDWTGLELKAARKRSEWATIQRYPSGFTFPGGESFVAMQARIIATLERLRAAHVGEAIVAVSHADPIRAAVNQAMGAHIDMFQRVVVSPCSLTAITYGEGGPTVLTVNDTGATGALVVS